MREIWLVIDTVASLLVVACLLRVWGHQVSLHPRDMLMHFSCAITDWIVLPFRKILPLKGKGRSFDFAGALAALVIAIIAAALYKLVLSASAGAIPNFGLVVITALGWLLHKFCYLVMIVVFVQAIMSMVNPNSPISPGLTILSRPFLAPIRRFLPALGGIDFSPMVLILAIQILLSLLARVFPSFPGM